MSLGNRKIVKMLTLSRSVVIICVIWTIFLLTHRTTALKDDSVNELKNVIDRSSQLKHSSLFYGLLNEIVISDKSKCAKDAQIILDGIQNRNVWALKSRM